MSRTINLRNHPHDQDGDSPWPPRPSDDDSPSEPADLAFLLPAVQPDEIGRLGNYRVLRLLGQGGMAFVFHAEDVALRRSVALKVMKPGLEQDADGWERFLREARLMASIKHPHLVTVYQVGQEGRLPYLAMELLQGETLDARMRRSGRIRLPEILRLAREIAGGLAVVHRHGLVHRDVKPANIWLEGPEARVKILDFGLARCVRDDARLTRSGMIVGTPAFMAPEQARGETPDARSDLFSLGCVLYEMCSGVRPFDAPTTMAALTALAVKDPSPLHELRSSTPRGLSDLVARLLAKGPAGRPDSAEAVLALLSKIDGRPAAGASPPRTPSATVRQTPTRPKTRTRKKKAPAPRRPWVKLLLAVVLPALAVVTVGSAAFVAFAPGRANPPAAGAPAAAVFLSALTPTDDRNPIKAPPGPPPGSPEPPPPPFAGVRVHGQLSPHGIFMHPTPGPNGGTASLRYTLGKQYGVFHAETSLNDGPGQSETPLTFSVFGDGRLLWQSRPLRGQADADRCDVSVRGVDALTIQVDCPGAARGRHGVWVEPCVTP